MILQDKLDSIDEPKLPSFSMNVSKNVEDYWCDFIEPNLPKNIDVIIEWHNLIKRYVKMPDTVLAFRTGNTKGHLRRGWETVTNDGYSFFYIDNYFPHYFYKMAYDGYVPSLDEFYYSMKSKQFPVRIRSQMGTEEEPEREYAAFNVDGKDPGIGKAGYKLAHILDTGRNYVFNGKQFGITEICKKFFNLGEVSDWEKDSITGKYCRKDFIIPSENKTIARKLAEACFIRLIHPMNYFVSPKSRNNGKIFNIYRNGYNIAEDSYVISFVRSKFHERFRKNSIDYFQEFLDLVYSPEDLIKERGDTVLSLIYSPTPLWEIESNDKIHKEDKNNNVITSTVNYNSSITQGGIKTVTIKDVKIPIYRNPSSKVQDFIKQTLEILFAKKLLSDYEISLLQNENYCKNTFEIEYPLLQQKWENCVDRKGHRRYWGQSTKKQIGGFYVCSQWWREKADIYDFKIAEWLKRLSKYNQELY